MWRNPSEQKVTHDGQVGTRNSNTRAGMKKLLLFAGKLLVSVAMLWFVFSRIEIEQIIVLISRAEWIWLLTATILFVLSKWVAAIRLKYFFGAAGVSLPVLTNLRLYLLGMFYNLFLPGGISGDAYKVFFLRNLRGTSVRKLVTATLIDRITGLVALVVIMLLLFLWLPLPFPIRIAAALMIPLTLVVSRLAVRHYFPIYAALFSRTNLQSGAVQILQLGSAFFILKALHFEGNYLILLALFLVSSVMAVVPVSFGGAGAREFTFAMAAVWLNMPDTMRESAITLGLVFYLITAAVSLTGVWYLFFPVRLPEDETDSGLPTP